MCHLSDDIFLSFLLTSLFAPLCFPELPLSSSQLASQKALILLERYYFNVILFKMWCQTCICVFQKVTSVILLWSVEVVIQGWQLTGSVLFICRWGIRDTSHRHTFTRKDTVHIHTCWYQCCTTVNAVGRRENDWLLNSFYQRKFRERESQRRESCHLSSAGDRI